MLSAARVRRGLWQFLLGRVLSGALGIVWLALLVQTLPAEQLGIYFGAQAVFEIVQLTSSLGLYAYIQRYLPQDGLQAPRRTLVLSLLALLAWRLCTLGLASLLVAQAWAPVAGTLGWAALPSSAAVFLPFLCAEGLVRLAEAMAESLLRQGLRQSVALLRNLLRISALALCASAVTDAAWVLRMESLFAGGIALGALGILLRQALALPADRIGPGLQLRRRFAFALQLHASLVLGLVSGIDSIKLVLAATAGPTALALFGVAATLAEMVGRHMPAQLLLDFVRAVLTARAGAAPDRTDLLFWPRLLLRVNGACLLAVMGWLAVFGQDMPPVLLARAPAGALAGWAAALLLVLFVQAWRQMLGLVAHIRADSRSVLWATLATWPVPLVVAAAAPTLGVLAAVLGWWLLELSYAAVLARRLGLGAAQLFGPTRLWWQLLAAALAAAAGGKAVALVLPGPAGTGAASLAYLALYAGLLWRLQPLEGTEEAALRRLFERA